MADISAQAIQKAIDLLNETIQNLNHSSSAYAESVRTGEMKWEQLIIKRLIISAT